MDEVKKWAVTVSAVSIISGVVSSMLPENSHKNVFRFVAGVVLVYAILQPLISKNTVDFNIEDYLGDNYEVSENIDKYAQSAMLNSAEKAIEDIFLDFAQNSGTTFEVDCVCSIDNGNVVIDEIRIINCSSEESISLVRQFARESGFDENVLIIAGD